MHRKQLVVRPSDGDVTDPDVPDVSGATLETSSAAQVYMLMDDDTTLVTAQVMGASPNSETTAVYIYGYPTLDVINIDGTIDGEPADLNQKQGGQPGQRIKTDFQAVVKDEKDATVEGVPVKFDVKNKTGAGGTLIPVVVDSIVDTNNKVIENPRAGSTLYVRTDGYNGVANIGFELGSAPGDQVVEVRAVGFTKTIKASTPSAGSQQLSIRTQIKDSRETLISLILLRL